MAEPQEDPKGDSQYIRFKCLPPGGPLNRWSHNATRGHDFPGAQVGSPRRGSPPKEMLRLRYES